MRCILRHGDGHYDTWAMRQGSVRTAMSHIARLSAICIAKDLFEGEATCRYEDDDVTSRSLDGKFLGRCKRRRQPPPCRTTFISDT